MFTIEEILGCTFLQRDKNAFNYIMKTLSEDEKSKIDWEKAKEDIYSLPIDAQKFIKKSFPEVFQEVVSSKPQQTQEQVICFNKMPGYSVSGNFYEEEPIVVDAFSSPKTNTTLIGSYKISFKVQPEGRGERTE